MKKFYTLLVTATAALLAAGSASAVVPAKNIKVADAPIQQILRNDSQGSVKVASDELTAPAKAPVKRSPALVSDIEGDWVMTYTGMLNNNSGSHEETATFTWVDQYQQFEVSFEALDKYGVVFYADYNELTGQFTFGQEPLAYANAEKTLYAAQYPLKGTSGTMSVTATYNDADKTIRFDDASYGLGLAQTNTFMILQGWYWAANNIVFERPDGDYKLKIDIDEECSPNNEFVFIINAGDDIVKVKAILTEGDFAAEPNVDYVDILGEEFETGVEYSLKPAAYMEETGYFSILAYGYDAEGNVRKSTQAAVFVTLNEDDDYVTIGTIPFTDYLVNGYYNGFSNVKEAVELQESSSRPGVYRLVEAYAGQGAHHNPDCKHYIYIDAQDPEFTNMMTSATGLDFGDGLLVMGTLGGALGYSKEQCIQYGYTVGNRVGRVITFPTRTVLAHEQYYNEPGSWSYMNPNNEQVITLPDLVLNVEVSNSATNEPTEGATVTVTLVNEEGVKVLSEDATEITAETDVDGKATLNLPDSYDYLADVMINVTDCEGVTVSKQVKLNGAQNTVAITADNLTGVESIAADKAEAVEYFNLQGVRIATPEAGQLVIKKQGTSVSKVLVK